MAKKKKLWILVSALAVVLAAAVTAGALFLPGIFGWDRSAADPYVKWYSEETSEYVITTADQLYDMAYLSSKYDFEGQTFVLGADIVFNEGDAEKWLENAPDRLWYPIKGFAGTFDGQGHTISGLYSKVFNEDTGLFSDTHRRAVVKNLKVVNSLIVSYGEHPAGFISADGAGTFDTIYIDGILWSDNWNNGGIMGAVTENGDTLFTNCWFDGDMILKSDQGRVAGGIVGDIMMQSGVCTIEHCLSTGTFSAEAITNTSRGRLMDIGGLVGRASAGTTNISDCIVNTDVDSECIEGIGTLIGSAGKGTTNITHSYVPKHETLSGIGYRYNKTVGDIYTYAPEYVTGYNAYKWTTLDFEEFWAVDEDGTPILQSFADTIPNLSNVEREIDTSWYTKVTTYRIKNYKQLLGLHVISQFDNLSGKIIMLTDDIVIQEGDANEWRENAPAIMHKKIGSANVMFAGTFDGGGHSISGVYYKSAASGGGFFTALGAGSIVRNFRLLNSYIECNQVEVAGNSYSYTGSIAAYAQGTVLDRVYSNAIVVNDGEQAGGLVGMMRNGKASTVTNCWFDGKVIMHGEIGYRGGGLVGVVWNTGLTVSHCLMSGDISSEGWQWGANQGAVVGYPNANSVVRIEDTLCTGKFQVKDGKADATGMLCGRIAATATVTFADAFALKHKNEANSEWLCEWGFTGHRGTEPFFEGAAVIMEGKYLYGSAGYQYTSLDFGNYWDVDPKGYPVLKTFNENEAPDATKYGKLVDYSWFDSTKETYYISNRRQLMGLSFLSTGITFKDKVIYQTANITVNSGDAKTWEKKAPYIKWMPIGSASCMFQGTYNGGGHTISGIYLKDGTNGLGLFGMIKNATIKNLKLKNSYIESNMSAKSKAEGKYTNYSYIGGIAAYAAKTTFDTIYTDVIVKNDGEMTGGIVGLSNTKEHPITLRKCWFDGTLIQNQSVKKKDGSLGSTISGGLIGLLRNNNATIEHCLSTATFVGQNVPDGTWGTVSGGFVGRSDQTGTNPGGKLTIKDSFANIKIEGYPASTVGNAAVVCHANPNTYLKLENVFAVSTSWPAIVANRTYNKDQTVESVTLPRMTGANAYMFSTLDFENYWSALEGKTPELKCFATGKVANPEDAFDDRVPDTSWYSDSEDEFVISNSAELLGFAELSKTKDFAGKTVKLGADIILNYGTGTTGLMDNNGILAGVDPWTPIGTAVTPFRGVFDGQGYSISGLAERASGQSALFSYVEDAFIQNVTIERSIFRGGSGGGKSAAIAANTAGTTTIKRVKIADTVRLYNATYQGGIVAYNTGKLIIDNVWSDVFSNPQWSSNAFVGGILGGNANTAGVTATISNALFTGEFAGTVSGESFVGGLVGAGGNNAVTTVKDSLSNGEMKVVHGGTAGKMYIGTLFGTKSWTAANTVMEDVYATVEAGCVYKVIDEVLAPTDEFFGAIRDDQAFDSGVYVVKTEDILGELAKNNASGLDYENYWTAVEGKTPELLNPSSGEPTPDPITEPDKVEKDTSWYNDTDTEFVLMDAADLNGFALLSQTNNFAGKTVKLGADITVNEGDASTWATTAPEIDWTPISTQANGFQGTFDGQGHTISGLYMDDDNAGDAGYGLVGCINGGTVTNIKLVNSAFVRNTASTWTRSASIVGTAYKGTISNIYSDAYIYANGQWAGGIVGLQRAVKSGGAVVESELVISNCWYNGVITATSGTTNIGGITGGAHEGDGANVALTKTTIDNCLFTGHILSDYNGTQAAIGGIFGYTSNTTVNITDSMATGSIVSETNAYVASSYGYKNWAAKVNLSDIYVAEDTAKYAYYNVEHNVSGVTVANIKAVAREDILGNLATTNVAGLDFTNTWTTVENNVPVLKAFSDCVPMEPIIPEAPAITPDTSWYDSSKTEFVISTAEELYGLAELSATNTFAGKTIKLGADITVNAGDRADWATTAPERKWSSIGGLNSRFAGTFDGQGHTISGLYLSEESCYAGLFGVVDGGTIKNFKLVNSYFETTASTNGTLAWSTTAAVAGLVYTGDISNIYTDAYVSGGSMYNGGIVGLYRAHNTTTASSLTISDCWFDGELDLRTTGRSSGGILGGAVEGNKNYTTLTFENCLMTGSISGSFIGGTDPNSYINLAANGGLFGCVINTNITMKDILIAGEFTMADGASYCGALYGYKNWGVGLAAAEDIYVVEGLYNVLHLDAGHNNMAHNAKVVAEANLLGNLAKTNAPGLDYVEHWTTVENGLPELRLSTGTVTPPATLTPDTSWYSENASEFTIDTAAELLGLAELAKTNNFSGKTIKLGADIEFNTGDSADWATTAPANVWTSIGNLDNMFAGTFDGQGHTISGLYMNESTSDAGTAMFCVIKGATITNFKLVNSYIRSSATMAANAANGAIVWSRAAAVVGTAYSGTVSDIYTDAYVSGGAMYNGGIVGLYRATKVNGSPVATTLTVSGCWFDGELDLGDTGRHSGGIVGGIADGTNTTMTLNITNCLMTGKIKFAFAGNIGSSTINGADVPNCTPTVGGLTGYIANSVNNYTDSLVAGTIDGTAGSLYVGSVFGMKNWNTKTNATDVYYTAENYNGVSQYINPLNGANTALTSGSFTQVTTANLLGDLAKTNAPGLDYENVWTTVENKLPELKKLSANNVPAVDPTVETTEWYDASKTEFTLNTLGEFKGFVTLSKTNNFAGKTVKLNTDIAFNEGIAGDKMISTASGNPYLDGVVATDPIGSKTVPFAGTFDGQGHTVSGLASKTGYDALFAATDGATIKNVKVARSTLRAGSGGGCSAGLVGTTFGTTTIENVYIGKDVNLWNATHQGGVVGQNNGKLTVKNTWSEAYVNPQWGANVYIGGIVADNANTAGLSLTLENCLYSGSMAGTAQGQSFVGGLIGAPMNNPTITTLTDCLVAGNLTGLVTSTGELFIGSVIGSKSWTAAKTVTTDVYATAETYKNAEGVAQTIRPDQSFTAGTVTAVEKANLLGELAKTNAPGLDYVNVWTTVEGKTPELRHVAEAIPETVPDEVDPNEETTEWYGDGSATEFTLNTLGEFKGFVTLSQTNSFKGKTIKLGTDIVWNEGNAADWATTAPANVWTPIGDQDNGFLGTFDGQGHTVSGLYCVDTIYASFVARLYSPGVVKNVNIVNSYFRSNGNTRNYSGAGIVSRLQGGATVSGIYTNAIFEAVWDAGIVASVPSGTATITNCWFDGTVVEAARAGGILGFANAADTYTITNCLSTGSISGTSTSEYAYYGGLVGVGNYNTILKMTSCLSAADMSGVTTTRPVGSVVGNNPGGNRSVYTNVYATNESHANLMGAGGATFPVTAVAEAEILGDLAKTKLTGFDFDTIWATNENSTPVLKAFVAFAPEVAPEADPNEETTEWYGDGSATEYTISTVGELKGFVTLSQTNNFSGKTVKLGADIVWNEGNAADWATTAPANSWTPIGSVSVPFAGTFDGQGHTISGLYLKYTATDAGLFGGTGNGAVIKNFKLTNSYIESSNQHVGSIIGRATGTQTIENVYSDADIKGTFSTNEVKTGGFIGSLYGNATINFKDCEYAGDMNVAAYGAGGFVGYNQNAGHINLNHCDFTGTLTGANHWLGGFFGNNTNASFKIDMVGCMSTGRIVSTHASNSTVGQFIGRMSAGTATSTGCYGVLNTYYNTSTIKEAQIGQGTVNGATALISNKARALMEEYHRAGIELEFGDMAKYWATTTPFEISTVGQLYAFNLMGQCYNFSGKTVKLTADITINSGNASDWATTAPKYNWMPIGNMTDAPATAFAGTFDGQGHTISGLYCAHAGGNGLGMFREVQGTVTNFKLVNSYLANTAESNYGYNGGIASFLNGGTISKVYTDAIVETVDSYAGGIVGMTGGATATVSQCQFDGTLNARCALDGSCDATATAAGNERHHARYVGGIIGCAGATSNIVTDCISSGLIINIDNHAHRTGGIIGGSAAAGKSSTITGCFSIGEFRCDENSYHFNMIMDLRQGTSNTTLTNLTTVFTDNYVLTQKLYNMDGSATLNSNGNLTGCNKNTGVTVPGTIRYTEAEMIAKIAEQKAAGTSNLDFVNVWTYTEGKLPALKAFAD